MKIQPKSLRQMPIKWNRVWQSCAEFKFCMSFKKVFLENLKQIHEEFRASDPDNSNWLTDAD